MDNLRERSMLYRFVKSVDDIIADNDVNRLQNLVLSTLVRTFNCIFD